MPASFHSFCKTLQQIREAKGTKSKIEICSGYFSSLENDEDLKLSAQFIGEGAFEIVSGKRASAGSRTSGLAASTFCGIDYDHVFKPCRAATGSNSETIGRLMANIQEAIEKRQPETISLGQAASYFEELYKASSRADKIELLWRFWKKMHPVEIKYFTRMLGRGSLRIGFETRSVETAIAKTFRQNPEKVRYAHMITGSIGKTAVLAKQNRLDEAPFRLFQPLSFMLASPIESRPVENLRDYTAEEKFDGMRAQVHTDGKKVKIYSRDLNDRTRSFPDIVQFFSDRNLPPLVFDGEICVYKDETLRPFQLLQKRLEKEKPAKKLLENYPVLFITFDLLFADGEPLFDLTLTERRKKLEQIAGRFRLPVANQFEIRDFDELDRLFEKALQHGNEGIVLKNKKSVYEYGQRNKSWLKVKKPGGTFHTVMMYAHTENEKSSGTYSGFTLGISVKDDERYEEEFIPIGKVHGGYTDEESQKINQKIKELTVEKYGPTLGLLPELVVEIEFDDIRVNKRTKAGYTLRHPQFRAIRWDLGPGDVNTLHNVEKFFFKKIDQESAQKKENPSFLFYE